MLERVRKLVAADAIDSPRIQARAELTRNHGGRLTLVVRVASGDVEDTRTATSRSCAALGEAAAIMLATALDAARERRLSEERLANEENDAPKTTTPELEERTREERASGPAKRQRTTRPPPRRSPIIETPAVGLGAGALFDFGTLPRPASGLELAAHLRLRRWRLGVAGSLWLPRDQSFAARGPGGARLEVLTFGGFACWTPLGERFRLGTCAELDVSRLDIAGFGIRRPSVARGTWPTVRTGILGEARLSRSTALFVRADAAFAVAVPRIVLTTATDEMALHEVGSPALHLTIGGYADIF